MIRGRAPSSWSPRSATVVAILGMAATLAAPTAACAHGEDPSPIASRHWSTTGIIRSFEPGRSFVNIAHDDIPGYLSAMTMSFEPSSRSQLDRLPLGDRVVFEFFDTADARRILVA